MQKLVSKLVDVKWVENLIIKVLLRNELACYSTKRTKIEFEVT